CDQARTRPRWRATKLAIIGAGPGATVGLLSWAVTTWAHRIDDATGDRITPWLYAARGVVPIGYAVFGFVLGVTPGMLLRRPVPAMAVTLGSDPPRPHPPCIRPGQAVGARSGLGRDP